MDSKNFVEKETIESQIRCREELSTYSISYDLLKYYIWTIHRILWVINFNSAEFNKGVK